MWIEEQGCFLFGVRGRGVAHYSVRRYSEIKDVYALSEMEMLLIFKRNRMTRGHGGRVENRTDRVRHHT